MTQLVLLDRDATVNVVGDDGKAVWPPRLRDGCGEALQAMTMAGCTLAVCSNQDGKHQHGNVSVAEYNAELAKLLALYGVNVAAWYCVGEAGDFAPKPAPHMLQVAMSAFAMDKINVVYVGDDLRDLQAADAAGVHCCLLAGGTTPEALCDATSWADAVTFVLAPWHVRQKYVRQPWAAEALMTGSFDMLHWGHMWALERLADTAEWLVPMVAVNSDASYVAYKGRQPRQGQMQRMMQVATLLESGNVTLLHDTEPSALIRRLQPALYCNSAEYGDEPVEMAAVRDVGCRYAALPRLSGWSSTALRKDGNILMLR